MNDAGTAHFNIPNLLFDNRTPHAASQFDMVDQFGEAFHVVVARMGYTLGPCGADGLASLLPMARQSPLATEDRHLDGDTQAGTVQESDFAPYKPRCDVIVNGVAHAPRGQAMPQFLVNIKVKSEKKILVDKTLQVSGERAFRKKDILTRLAQGCARIATVGLLRPNPWQLSAPVAFLQLPLRYAYAYGGQCRIEADDCNAAAHDSARPTRWDAVLRGTGTWMRNRSTRCPHRASRMHLCHARPPSSGKVPAARSCPRRRGWPLSAVAGCRAAHWPAASSSRTNGMPTKSLPCPRTSISRTGTARHPTSNVRTWRDGSNLR